MGEATIRVPIPIVGQKRTDRGPVAGQIVEHEIAADLVSLVPGHACFHEAKSVPPVERPGRALEKCGQTRPIKKAPLQFRKRGFDIRHGWTDWRFRFRESACRFIAPAIQRGSHALRLDVARQQDIHQRGAVADPDQGFRTKIVGMRFL